MLALSETTYAQVAVSPETAMGVPQNQVSANREGDYCTLTFNNLINQYYKIFTIHSHTTSQIDNSRDLLKPLEGIHSEA